MPDVFLSYSSKDRAAAQRVQQALEARGIDVFWDQEMPPGQDWDTWIRGKLTACKLAVVLWSRTSVASDNVRHEALVARKAKKLLPAMIDPIAAEDLPMDLYMVQTVNLIDWRDANSKGLARLADEITAQIGRPAASPPVTKPTPAKAKASTSGPSPRMQTTIALVAIAAVVGGAAWFMTQQQPATLASAPTSASADGAPAPQTSPAGATCLDGSTPAQGVCTKGNRPNRPAPVLGAGSAETLSRRLVGHWNWDGLPCADGPNVTIESGKLVFTARDSRFVHSVESERAQQVLTRVLEPSFALGEQYALTP